MKFLWFGSDPAVQPKVIYLEWNPATTELRFVLWADVPADQQALYADANATSAFADIDSTSLGNLRKGAIREKVDSIRCTYGAGLQELVEVERADVGQDLTVVLTRTDRDKLTPSQVKSERIVQAAEPVVANDPEGDVITTELLARWQAWQDEVNQPSEARRFYGVTL